MLYLSAVSSPGSTSCITSWLAVSAGKSTNTACNLYVFGICYLFCDLHHWKWRKWQGCLKSLPLKSAIHRKIIAHQENCLVSGDNISTLPILHLILTVTLCQCNVTWSSTVALVLGMFPWSVLCCFKTSSEMPVHFSLFRYLKLSTIVWPARPSSRLETICPASCPPVSAASRAPSSAWGRASVRGSNNQRPQPATIRLASTNFPQQQPAVLSTRSGQGPLFRSCSHYSHWRHANEEKLCCNSPAGAVLLIILLLPSF